MEPELISRKTRQKFREYFVTTSLAHIEDAFGAEGFVPDLQFDPPVGGQRRALVEQFYHEIDWRDKGDVERVLRVFEAVLVELDLSAARGGDIADHARATAEQLRRWIERDGIREIGGRLFLPADGSLPEPLSEIASPELQRQIARISDAVDSDPALAIGTAKELVETVCKIILVEREITPDSSWDLLQLVKEARRSLSLLPDDIDQAAKGASSIKRLLSNLASLVNGLSELRNLYGTGHGKHGKAKGVHPRHARLAVGAAATLATFLLETHEERDGRAVTDRSSSQASHPPT